MWYGFYKTDTGELVSMADELNPKLPKGIEVVELGDDFDQDKDGITGEWNPQTKTFDDKLPPIIKTKEERIAEINADLKLTPEQLEALEKYL